MPSYPNLRNFWSRAKDTAAVAALALVVLALASPPAAAQVAPVPITSPITSYASWGDQNNRNQGMVFIYPLEDGTDLNLYQTTSTTSPIQINTLVVPRTGAAKDVPIAFGPLTDPQHFFKLQSNKRVNWELVTPDYSSFREASRFVASERQTFLGTKFVFHADGASSGEEIVIINPGTTASTVTIEKFNTVTLTYGPPLATTTILAGGFDEFSVNASGLGKAAGKSLGSGTGHYRITVTSGSPVLVWEGRWFANNTTIAAASDGSTIGSTIFASSPNDEFNAGNAIDPTGVVLRIVGITAASYTIHSSPGPGFPFAVVGGGSVAAGGVASVLDLPEDKLYKITTSAPGEKIQVQYGPKSFPPHGAVMIGGNDGGVTTNPGTSFRFFFEGSSQKAIDVLIPQSGTSVTVTGPASTSLTSTVPDQVLHFLPATALPVETSAAGLYTVTASNPVWVVLTGEFGDQQGYFVYTGTAEVSSSLGPINLRYCHSAGHSGDPACVKNGLATTGKVASQSPPETGCAPGQPTKGTANVRVIADDRIAFAWDDINCGTVADGSQSFLVNSVRTAALPGTVLELKAEHAMNTLVRLRVVPPKTGDDRIDRFTEPLKNIVVESVNETFLRRFVINGDERLVIQFKDTVPDVVMSAAVKFQVGSKKFFPPQTIIVKAFHNGNPDPVGVDTRVLSGDEKTGFSELQVYTPGNFGNNAFDKLEFSAARGSFFGLGPVFFNTTRPVSP